MQPVPTKVAFWMEQTSGLVKPAVRAYLAGRPLSRAGVFAIRGYLRGWVAGDFHGGEELFALRRGVDEIGSAADIKLWLEKAQGLGIDPF